nr:MAG TPA: hypothetical protein [Caudoviricetes sp.]
MCQQGNVKYKKHGKECRINTAMAWLGEEVRRNCYERF